MQKPRRHSRLRSISSASAWVSTKGVESRAAARALPFVVGSRLNGPRSDREPVAIKVRTCAAARGEGAQADSTLVNDTLGSHVAMYALLACAPKLGLGLSLRARALAAALAVRSSSSSFYMPTEARRCCAGACSRASAAGFADGVALTA